MKPTETNLKEAFNFYDKDNDGLINSKLLLSALRALGINPNEEEVREMLLDVGLDESDRIKFDDFVFIANKQLQSRNPKNEILKAFKVFDTNNDGKINTEEFVHIMTNLCEPLTKEEINEIIHEADPNNQGFIDINSFANALFL